MQAIDSLDAGVLNTDLVPQLVALIPSEADIDAVKDAVDAHGGYAAVAERLGAAERFFMEIARVRRLHAKVKVLQFKQDFVEMTADITVRRPHAWPACTLLATVADSGCAMRRARGWLRGMCAASVHA
jgi:Formin Homology 2 Domain